MGNVWVELVENAVFRYPVEELNGWRFYRIAYWDGEQPYAVHEGGIWLPPMLDSWHLEDFINQAALLKPKGRRDDESTDE
jgi:hypothetical protein